MGMTGILRAAIHHAVRSAEDPLARAELVDEVIVALRDEIRPSHDEAAVIARLLEITGEHRVEMTAAAAAERPWLKSSI
jgi:hypothetical protein